MASSSRESGEPKGTISEYEKRRFSRIAENNARLEALGIFKSAKALSSPPPNSRKRRATNPKEDDDYRPLDDEDDEDEDFLGNSTCKRKNNKASPSPSKTKRSLLLSNKNLNTTGDDDTDDDFDKAIALSLQARGSPPTNQDSSSATKKKKHQPVEFMSKMQMTDDELLIYFYQFDEAGKGFITLRDVANMATVHDFTWTEEELQDMIRCFDMDKDGKLSLDDFRKIATRCRMLKKESS
ncbi:PREDICTED: probable calcium-binding protein CML18 [Camelina sativa]|uniref:Probable calcium-binding protein CML18 n=1 Tax=Camelina sativa TaxID=90675 RepID=A0ABM0T1K6_CAMSA|nr:PREDICTED: probable calcium-binding protein CML18 [Camelina sativa]